MKWWWMFGGILIVVLMEVNVRVYGGAATFGVPIGWMITILVMTQFRKPTSTRWVVSFGLIIVSIGLVLSVPSYSVAEAEETLDKMYNDVTYMESVPTTGGEWNPFTPRVGYRFETGSGASILFIPDSGNTFEL